MTTRTWQQELHDAPECHTAFIAELALCIACSYLTREQKQEVAEDIATRSASLKALMAEREPEAAGPVEQADEERAV
mgnify:CR=1 FL=1